MTLTRAVVGLVSPASVVPLLDAPLPMRATIGPTAMRIFQQTLATGVVLSLMRRGGARQARSLRDGAPVRGRLVDRHPTPTLTFGPPTFEVMRWLVVTDLRKVGPTLELTGPLTLADELIVYSAADLLLTLGRRLRNPVWRTTPLAWLGMLPQLAEEGLPERVDFTRHAADSLILEALSPELTLRWVAMEKSKAHISEPAALERLGEVQATVLEAFTRAIDEVGRRDLASFLVAAGGELLDESANLRRWVGGLDARRSLADRQRAAQASGAFLRALREFAEWSRQHGLVRFFDDDYDVAQMLLGVWEPLSQTTLPRAERLIAQLESAEGLSGSANR